MTIAATLVILALTADAGSVDAMSPDGGTAPDSAVEGDAERDGSASDSAASLPPPPVAAPALGRVKGRLLAKGTREAIGGAVLAADGVAVGESDASGTFAVDVPCGSRTLVIQAAGFEAITTTVNVCANPGESLTFRMTPGKDQRAYTSVVRAKPAQPAVHLAAEELTQTAGSLGDPLRVIESLPGVATVAWPAPIYAVRGSNPGNTGFFLDGIRIPALFHFALGPSVIHPYLLESVDFFPGGYPARFGRYAGGIVAANTRRPPEDRVHTTVDLRLYDAGALVSAPLPGGGSVAVAGRYSYTAGLISLLSEDVRLGYWDLQLRADRQAGPFQLTLLVLASEDVLAIGNTNDPAKELNLGFRRISLRASAPVVGGRVQASIALGSDKSRSPIAQTVPIALSSLSAAPRFSYSRSFRLVETAIGFDGELIRYDPATTIVRPTGDWDLGTPRTAILLGGYASATVRAGGLLLLTPEIRYDTYRVSGTRAGDVGPRLTAEVKVRSDTVVKVAGGRFTQLPSLPLQVPGADGFGLRLFGLQQSWQGSVGVETSRVPDLALTVTGYVQRYVLTDLRNPTQLRPDPLAEDLLVRRDALSYGVEVMARRPRRLPLHGWLSYTLSRNLRALGGGVVGPSDWDQRHILNLVVGYRVGHYTLGGRVHLNTGRPYPVSGYTVDEYHRLPTFYQVDLRIDRRFVFDRFILDIYAEVVNATLTRQVYSIRPSGPGMVREDGMRLVLPSLGVRGEF